MVFQQFGQIDVTHAIAVCQHECGVAKPALHSQQSAARQCLQSGIDQIDVPAFRFCFCAKDVAGGEIDGQIPAEINTIKEIALDEIAHVTEGNVEIIEAMVGEVLHDVPQDRFATNLDHWFWSSRGFLLQACAHSTRENDNSHYPLRSNPF